MSLMDDVEGWNLLSDASLTLLVDQSTRIKRALWDEDHLQAQLRKNLRGVSNVGADFHKPLYTLLTESVRRAERLSDIYSNLSSLINEKRHKGEIIASCEYGGSFGD